MRLNRFILKFDIATPSLTIKDAEIFNQIKNVLRFEVGDKLLLSNGEMKEAVAEITGFGKDEVSLFILERMDNDMEPAKSVTLYCAVLKKENFEWVVQKATEAGVKKIVPMITDRTVKMNLRMDRLEKIAKEAAEQSGRGMVPAILPIISFDEAVSVCTDEIKILFDISGENMALAGDSKTTSVFIGPEGGWTEREITFAKEKALSINKLGKLVLRAETAAIIGSFAAVHL